MHLSILKKTNYKHWVSLPKTKKSCGFFKNFFSRISVTLVTSRLDVLLLQDVDALRHAVVEGFHCDVTSCELARRGVRRGAAESSACGYGRAVGLTSIIDRRSVSSS